MAPQRDDNDVAGITSLSTSIPNTILLALYGGRMSILGDANNRWSYRVGPAAGNNLRYIHADSVANFNICGQLPLSSLVPGRAYKGTFDVELTSVAAGWQGSFSVSLTVPNSQSPIQPRDRIYNQVGSFQLGSNTFQLAAWPQRNATLSFNLSHTGEGRRNGLIVKRFVIQEA